MAALSNDKMLARLAKNLPRLRRAAGLTLAEVGRRADSNATAIKEIEEGRRMPGAALLTRIAAVYGETFDGIVSPRVDGRRRVAKKTRRSA